MFKNIDFIKSILVIDFETTGLYPRENYPIEFGALKVYSNRKMDYVSTIKLPKGMAVPKLIQNYTGLTTEMINKEGVEKEDLKEYILETLIDSKTLVIGHNVNFDLGFLYEHFNIEPEYFMCTRTIEFLTNPHLPLSLSDVYPRYYYEKKQTHRALGDVWLAYEVFEKQVELHGEAMKFFLNKVIRTPERDLTHIPYNATVLDFTKKFDIKR